MGSLLLCGRRQGQAIRARRTPGSWSTSPPAAPRARRPTSRSRRARSSSCGNRLNEIYVRHTGQPIDVIERKLERDSFMSAEEAKEFGLVDQVVENRPLAAGIFARRSGSVLKATTAGDMPGRRPGNILVTLRVPSSIHGSARSRAQSGEVPRFPGSVTGGLQSFTEAFLPALVVDGPEAGSAHEQISAIPKTPCIAPSAASRSTRSASSSPDRRCSSATNASSCAWTSSARSTRRTS